MFNLLDRDESNQYSPKRNVEIIFSEGDPVTYDSNENKFKLNHMSNRNLTINENDENSKEQKYEFENDQSKELMQNMNPSNTNLTDDATLEQIFLNGKDCMFRVSEKKSINTQSFKGSFGEMYHGGGGSTKTGKNAVDIDSMFKMGGSMGDPKRRSLITMTSQRDSLQARPKVINLPKTENQGEKKHFKFSKSMLNNSNKA